MHATRNRPRTNLLHNNGCCGDARLTRDHTAAVRHRPLQWRTVVEGVRFGQRAAHRSTDAREHFGACVRDFLCGELKKTATLTRAVDFLGVFGVASEARIGGSCFGLSRRGSVCEYAQPGRRTPVLFLGRLVWSVAMWLV